MQEDTRAAWGWTIVEQLGQDVRYALRTMAANRLFTVLVVLSLGLGIGANTAIYSFVDAILLRSLPVSDPESLVVLNWHAKGERVPVMRSMSGSTWGDSASGTTTGIFPFPVFELLRTKDAVFASVFAHFQYWQTRSVNVTIRGEADLASGWHVSGGYFRGLGVRPAAGRLIGEDDDRPGAPAVAVVSYALSQRRFGGPAGAAGQSILIDNLPFTVVGVAPPEFFGVDPAAAPDVYLPLHTLEYLGAGKQFGFRRVRLPGRALLLDPDHGPPPSGSDACPGAGRIGPGVSSMGRQNRDERPRAGEPARARSSEKGRAGWTPCGGRIPTRSTSCSRWLD